MKKTTQIYTVEDLAKKTNLSCVTIWKYIHSKKIYPDYWALSKSGKRKFSFFNETSIKSVLEWHNNYLKNRKNATTFLEAIK